MQRWMGPELPGLEEQLAHGDLGAGLVVRQTRAAVAGGASSAAGRLHDEAGALCAGRAKQGDHPEEGGANGVQDTLDAECMCRLVPKIGGP